MLTKSHYILVVGGAGFIGSHMLLSLRRAGYIPVVLDNLSRGHRDAVIDAELIIGDMDDVELVTRLFASRPFAAVMHFASFIEVGESTRSPLQYYQNNVAATITFLNVMLKSGVKKIIFSSSAAIYGEPQATLLAESHVLKPINPYGRSKLMVEGIIQDLAKSDELQYAILRYFNAAGADPEGRLGERHEPETHLIPLLLQVASGLRHSITVHGHQYPTVDGTCVRDYVHVSDICNGHLLALQSLLHKKKNFICNLGTGKGHSVFQVLNTVRRVTKQNILAVNGTPRPGDPAVLVADARLAQQELRWVPKYSALDIIVQHAWDYMQK